MPYPYGSSQECPRAQAAHLSLWQRERGIGAESEGKRLQSMEEKRSLRVQRRKAKRKA